MKVSHLKSRLIASGFHLLFSASIVFLCALIVFLVWYPNVFIQASGVLKIVLILFSVDLVLGPLITFIIYKTDKKHFFKDMLVVLLVQMSALGYGMYTLHQGRPVWAVFVIDDIELISPASIHKEYQTEFKSEYRYKFWQKPTLVGASYSEDEMIAKRQKEGEMFEGVSLGARPETYQPIEQKKEQIIKKMKPIQELKKFNSNKAVDDIFNSYPEAVGYIPVKGFDKDISALVDQYGQILIFVSLRPWD